ncbi:MAG TPA: Rid family hydrolase, partial [Candidatus Binatia bacterium]
MAQRRPPEGQGPEPFLACTRNRQSLPPTDDHYRIPGYQRKRHRRFAMDREPVKTEAAPKAIGPYEQGIKAAGLIYTAGQIALDPKTGELIDGDIS